MKVRFTQEMSTLFLAEAHLGHGNEDLITTKQQDNRLRTIFFNAEDDFRHVHLHPESQPYTSLLVSKKSFPCFPVGVMMDFSASMHNPMGFV